MSADNGIYIVKFPEGYMVGYAQAIENIDWYLKNEDYKGYKEWCKDIFGDLVFEFKDQAILYAHKLSEEFDILEYGVSYIGEYPSFLGE